MGEVPFSEVKEFNVGNFGEEGVVYWTPNVDIIMCSTCLGLVDFRVNLS